MVITLQDLMFPVAPAVPPRGSTLDAALVRNSKELLPRCRPNQASSCRAPVKDTTLSDQNTFDRFDSTLSSGSVPVVIQRKLIEHTLVAPFQPLRLLTLSQVNEAPKPSSHRRECRHRSASKRARTRYLSPIFYNRLVINEHLWIQRISSCRLSPFCCFSLRRAAIPHRSTDRHDVVGRRPGRRERLTDLE